MKSSATLDSSPALAPTAGKTSFHEALVFHALKPFVHGGLLMTLPDGTSRHLGAPGAEVTARMQVNDANFFKRCALYGNVGFGESYVEGEWETDSIKAVIRWFILNISKTGGSDASSSRIAFVNLLRGFNRVSHLLRPNSVKTSVRNIAEHYDLGNDFYSLWLDETMTYSCAKFENPSQSLAEAQHAKYEALCDKLKLTAHDHVLEIGCGWGGFCVHAAKNHGCRITAVTISREQFEYATERVRRDGLSDKVEILLQDYRLITGSFDKIVSIEMLEAVGDAYVDGFFKKCGEVLKPEGLLAFQVITVPDCGYDNLRKDVDWIQKHIFPGSLLLSIARVNQAVNRTSDLFMHGLEDMGACYSRTLREWHDRFNAKLPEVRAQGFDERFIRKWNFYLQYCEAAFASHNISVVQAVYTRPNNGMLKSL